MAMAVAVVAVAAARVWMVCFQSVYLVPATVVVAAVAAARQVKEVPEAVVAAVHSDSLPSTQPGY